MESSNLGKFTTINVCNCQLSFQKAYNFLSKIIGYVDFCGRIMYTYFVGESEYVDVVFEFCLVFYEICMHEEDCFNRETTITQLGISMENNNNL